MNGVTDLLAGIPCLFAEGAPATPPAAAGSAFSLMLMLFVGLIIMWFLVIAPRKAQDKKAQKLIDSLCKGDQVMTTCGMIGTIYGIDKDAGEVVIEVDKETKTRIRFSIGAVYFVFNKDK